MKLQALNEKKIAVFGYGREGRSVLQALRRQCPDRPITILNDTPLKLDLPHVDVCTGESVAQRLQDFEVVIKSPGISAYRPDILAAQQAGVQFTSATHVWCAEHPQATTVCVTGTKGKSTTTSLIAHLLQATGMRVALGGNIGQPLLDIPDTPAPDVWVLELSSYQTSDFDTHPSTQASISILLNLFPEHLDWHGDVETYFRDKLKLLKHTTQGVRILNATDPLTQIHAQHLEPCNYFNSAAGFHHDGEQVFQGTQPLLPLKDFPLNGAHNASNLCAAFTVVQRLGVEVSSCLSAVSDFQGLPHRLQILGDQQGRTYVDDSISTTPQSAQAAVQAFPKRVVTLLLGGYERGLDWVELAQFATQRPIQTIITLPDNGARIAAILREYCPANACPKIFEAENMHKAIAQAQFLTPVGGMVILSPGAPSYGQFENYQERGQCFAKAAGF